MGGVGGASGEWGWYMGCGGGPAWWVVAQLGRWPAGPEPGGVSFPFLFVFLFCIFFLLFIFSSVLIQFKIFMHFIKLCLLHHNYLCNI